MAVEKKSIDQPKIHDIVLPEDVEIIIKKLPKAVQKRVVACAVLQYIHQVGEKDFNIEKFNVDTSIWLYDHMEKTGRKIELK